VYYQSEFTVPAYSATGLHPILRVNADGLGHGSIWVNGHNLGRYPEKVPAPGLYIPETWLKAGKNSIKIYDEDGALPNRVTISTEINASRIIEALTADKPAGL
jgi:beta-galactosidase